MPELMMLVETLKLIGWAILIAAAAVVVWLLITVGISIGAAFGFVEPLEECPSPPATEQFEELRVSDFLREAGVDPSQPHVLYLQGSEGGNVVVQVRTSDGLTDLVRVPRSRIAFDVGRPGFRRDHKVQYQVDDRIVERVPVVYEEREGYHFLAARRCVSYHREPVDLKQLPFWRRYEGRLARMLEDHVVGAHMRMSHASFSSLN